MSLVTQLTDFITRLGTEIKTMKTTYSGNNTGSLAGLNTTDKSSLLAAVNEVKTQANGKQNTLGYTAENAASKGVANGYAGLDSGGKVPVAQLPDVMNKNKGWYATSAALITAFPSATAGDYAVVGATDTVWIWDTDGTPSWKDGDTKGAVTSVNGLTGAVVIADVIAAGASGLMTGADKTKLNGIATGATANQTDAVLKDRANHTGTQLASTISNFAATVIASVLTGLSVATNSAIVAADTLLVALGKLQAQITAHLGSGGTAHADVVAAGASGFMTGADKTKLNGVATGATANDTDANLKARANHTGTQSADTLTDGTTNKAFLATERTKLTGIAAGATANQTDAYLLARANGTGTQTASTISDFAATVITAVLTGLSVATNAAISATDSILAALGKLQAQITAHSGSGGTAHADAVAAGASGFMSGADKTKLNGVAASATVNSTDATLLARANHTGTQSADTLTDGTTNKAFLATERIKLTGIASGATANSTDAVLKDRANHTGTQLASTISDFAATVIATVLTGLSVATNSAIAATDSILGAMGKLQAQITAHFGSGGATHAAVTTSVNGFMIAADKSKLDGVAASANNYAHPTGDGNLHVPATSTTNNLKVLKAGATAGSIAWGNVAFSELTSRPTTISAYGITDAYTKTEIGDIATDFVAAFNTAIA